MQFRLDVSFGARRRQAEGPSVRAYNVRILLFHFFDSLATTLDFFHPVSQTRLFHFFSVTANKREREREREKKGTERSIVARNFWRSGEKRAYEIWRIVCHCSDRYCIAEKRAERVSVFFLVRWLRVRVNQPAHEQRTEGSFGKSRNKKLKYTLAAMLLQRIRRSQKLINFTVSLISFGVRFQTETEERTNFLSPREVRSSSASNASKSFVSIR